MRITRRELAAALTSAAALAQTPRTEPGSLLTPEAELQAARQQVQANTGVLARAELPLTTEPAFAFKA